MGHVNHLKTSVFLSCKAGFASRGQHSEAGARLALTSPTLRISLAWEVTRGACPAPGPCRTWSDGSRTPSGSTCSLSAPPHQPSGSGSAAWPERRAQEQTDVRGTDRNTHRRLGFSQGLAIPRTRLRPLHGPFAPLGGKSLRDALSHAWHTAGPRKDTADLNAD